MKKGCVLALISGLSVLIILAIILVSTFFKTQHTKVTLEEEVAEQWSNVESAYQRRADLIPNLVSTVKGYAEHEKETLTEVIEARAKATKTTIDARNLNAETLQQFQAAQGALTSALSKLMVVVEKYPDLKANQNFLELQAQLEGTENRINVERRKYNEAVKKYNSYIRKMVRKFFLNLAGEELEEKEFFEAQEGVEEVPVVEF